MQSWLIPILFVLALGAVAIYAFRKESKQRQAALAYSRSVGYDMCVDTEKPPPLEFDLFDPGRSKKMSYRTWRADSADTVFRYQYTTGDSDNSTTHYRVVALVELPFRAPHTKIGKEGWLSKLGKNLGIHDIEVESPEFNDRFRVTGSDDRFAITLLDHTMIALLNSPNGGQGRIGFEFGGHWMLTWMPEHKNERRSQQELIEFLQWSQSVRKQLPGVLNDWYPR